MDRLAVAKKRHRAIVPPPGRVERLPLEASAGRTSKARQAGSAGGEGENHRVVGLNSIDAGPDPLDDAGPFRARYQRKRKGGGTVYRFQVTRCNAACHQTHQNLIGARFVEIQGLDGEGCLGTTRYSCFNDQQEPRSTGIMMR